MKYSKARIIMHLKNGIDIQINANSFVQFCIGTAILLVGVAIAALPIAYGYSIMVATLK